MRLPKMTPRWRNAALIMAFLGFISWARYLGVAEDAGSILVTALLNAAIWFGVVYVAFLVVRGLGGLAARSGRDRNPKP